MFKNEENKLELISIHIPKTAGRTFLTALGYQYLNKVKTVDQLPGWTPEVNKNKLCISSITPNLRCLHGHFEFKQIEGLYTTHEPKIITWFREPVQRVISNYFYSQKERIKKLTDIEDPLERTITFEEFVLSSNRQNVMTQWTSGIELTDFDFIGNIAWFDNDLKKLKLILDWKKNTYYLNKNVNSKFISNPTCKTTTITPEMIEMVKQCNQLDIETFNRFLELRHTNYFEQKKLKK